MKNKVNALMITALCGLLTGCNTVKYGTVSGSPYETLNGRTCKLSYDSLAVSGVGSLNYLKSSEAADASHFSNFIDGLVTHNEYGVLVLNLAESAEANANYTEFKFKLKSDKHLVWCTYKGTPYKHSGKVQYIKAADFVASAKAVSTYSNGSSTFYLLRDFISGALEYNLYTQIIHGKNTQAPAFKNITTDEDFAEYIHTQIEENYPNVYTAGGYDENPVTAADIPNIANMSRFGVVADDATNTVTYKLLNSSMYFPTMLTYSPYLPVNSHFLEEKGSAFGKASPDSILYNGPYRLDKMDETKIIYKKNSEYVQRADLQGFMTPRVDVVRYNLVKVEVDYTYIRNQFEKGNVDGFSLDPSDKEGWKRYVLGPGERELIDALQEPYNGLVNSRFLDTIGNCYGTNIVMERQGPAATSYYDKGTEDTVENTRRALRIQEVRQAIMASFDYSTYYSRNDDGNRDTILATQNLVHTYVPKNFVYDDNGLEYTEEYYARALQEYRGLETIEEAREVIETGSYTKRQEYSNAHLAELIQNAKDAIALYNSTASYVDDDEYGEISLPINLEYYSIWSDQKTQLFDILMIESMNKRLNGVDTVATDLSNLDFIRVVPTNKVTDKNYDKVSGSDGGHAAFDFSAVQWGWGADYGDPLTYMNTYTIGGDWSSVFDFVGYEYVPNIKVDGGILKETNLLKHYTETVRDGSRFSDNLTDRFSTFAAAEVELIEELAIYMPQVNYGQGWSLTVSKSAGYEMPTANYGLSSDRLTGMWILKDPLTREERNALRTQYEANKEAYKAEHPAIDIYGE